MYAVIIILVAIVLIEGIAIAYLVNEVTSIDEALRKILWHIDDIRKYVDIRTSQVKTHSYKPDKKPIFDEQLEFKDFYDEDRNSL